ncbi:MAG: alpha/beta hydrolase, partial [Novosphingobium sp.]|nr:alpha/beta hydrolase [Novosphingobium sp.]
MTGDFPPRPPLRATANGINIAYHDYGAGPAVFLLHGFPGLSFDWCRQVPALVAAGWRVVVPDLRGSGETGPQGDLSDYAMRNLCRDVIGLMDVLGLPRAAMVGHDFGGVLAWALGRDHTDRVAAVASLNTPYTRRTALDLAETMRRHKGESNYMVVFQSPGVGEAILESDMERTFRGTFRKPAMTLADLRADARLNALPVTVFGREPALMGDPIVDEAELAVYAAAFRRTGFAGAINWYRNFHRNWLDTENTADVVPVPSLMVVADNDIFLPPETTRGMERH